MANYSIAIDLAGTAHVFGRLPFMGLKDGSLKFKRWNTVSCDEPLHVPGPAGSKWEGGAVAARHFLLFSGGKVYGAGDNRANALGVVRQALGGYFRADDSLGSSSPRISYRYLGRGRSRALRYAK